MPRILIEYSGSDEVSDDRFNDVSRRRRKTTGSSLRFENDIENGKGGIPSRTNIVNEVRKVSDGSEFLGGFNLWRSYLGTEFAWAFLAGILPPFSLFRDEQP